MRWDAMRISNGGPAAPALFEREAVARSFDTPGFQGMTFFEVHARSIINRVPESSRMPFRWTINPYRGCSHACAYCLVGETPILMADGRTKPLADVGAGDAIYGTVRQGPCRRYVRTTVLAHWQTAKPAFRVTLEDGTSLITSGDHRFLTERGWKHVNGTMPAGPLQRPHLTTGSKLMGVGGFAEQPKDSAEYRRGYLCGLIRKRTIEGAAVKSDARLGVVSVEPLGLDLPMFDITTGTGDFIADGVVSHNCFARQTHTYLDLDAGHDFDSKIVVKVNAPQRVRAELAAPRWRGEHIAMGTNVDCYQRAEGRYRLMPGILAALRDAANPFSILTKGTLILRDADLLEEAAEVTDVGLAVSVGCTDQDLWRALEPGTPSPQRRLEACATLSGRGLPCGVLMGPVVPFLSDSPAQLSATVRQIAQAGASSVTPIVLHLRPGAREWFFRWLGEHHPDLIPRYRGLYGRGAYAPQAHQRRIAEQVRELARQEGIGRAAAGSTRARRAGIRQSGAQRTGIRQNGSRWGGASGTGRAAQDQVQLPLLP